MEVIFILHTFAGRNGYKKTSISVNDKRNERIKLVETRKMERMDRNMKGIKSYLTLLLLLFSVSNVFAQRVTGHVCAEKDIAIKDATVRFTSADSSITRTAITDAKGYFEIRLDRTKQKYVLTVSDVQYQTYQVLFANPQKDTDIGEIKMKERDSLISEVTVTGARRIEKTDGTLLFPSKIVRKTAKDGYELINKLMLPGIKVDVMRKEISMTDGSSVLIYINDKKVDKSDVMTLHPDEVLKVEFINNPGAEYGYDDNIGSVIKITTRKRDDGISLGANTQNAVTTKYGWEVVNARYNKGFTSLSADWSLVYNDITGRAVDQYDQYLQTDGINHIIQKTGQNTHLKYNQNYINLDYNVTVPEKHVIDIKLSSVVYNSPVRGQKQYVEETGVTPYYSFSSPTEHYSSPVVNLFYEAFLGKKQTLTLNAVNTWINTDYGYSQKEYKDEELETLNNSYGYNTDGKKYSLILESAYKYKFDKATLTVGGRYMYGHLKNTYTGYADYVNKIDNGDLYLYSQMNGNIGKLGYNCGIGVSNQSIRQDGESLSHWIFRPRLTLSYPIGTMSLKYMFFVSPIEPGLSMLSNITEQMNTLEYSIGNPALKMYSSVNNRLTSNISIHAITLQNTIGYSYSDKPIMEEIIRKTVSGQDTYWHTSDNQLRSTKFSDDFSLQAEAIKNVLTFQASFGYRYFESIGHTYRHYLSTCNLSAQADLNVGKWNIGLNWRSADKRLSGEEIYEGSPYNELFINYNFGNMRLGLSGMHLFTAHGETYSEHLTSRYLDKYLHIRVPSMGNMLMITFTWNLQKGKKHQSAGSQFNNGDYDSGIMKM